MANLTSLMSGGWEPDNELDLATNYELAMEAYEADHPEEFRIYDPIKTIEDFCDNLRKKIKEDYSGNTKIPFGQKYRK